MTAMNVLERGQTGGVWTLTSVLTQGDNDNDNDDNDDDDNDNDELSGSQQTPWPTAV